ncbi:homogentisate 1,2-dioxygenase [Moritella viscosa]|uniref:Homogentisate 1,2-dioxygenase n=1 Tax=Moritella viscosa TaxID=80854 RepID=A0A090K335_9GAMM|nr:homogentisate 1,2-dioxygenase [Moritella viscosa]CED58168.1 homogentisate 1,2-dioxygenase [Moritella viscosa]SGY94186.1 Homogentisate 1,2-dioxygenase [Moritella viscosa]SGZ05532.1 Homogentisate 1,2-dioxygenase [Moritella viscosa]SGZ05783.1 Homogentisate 1,2-dioxygenase [Moritella viscosa]SHO08756.1 Homogentisate 1,2-dioxygenase [Moritella viscosa]
MIRRISFPLRKGTYSRQAHADLPAQGMFEREVSREGFYGPATHLHHKHPPTGWSAWSGDHRPKAYNLLKLSYSQISPWDAPLLLHNAYCQIRFWQCSENMQTLVRNADGDDLLFIHQGHGELFCDYGHLSVEQGDYVLIPRSCLWRLEPAEPITLLMIEATNDYYGLPDKTIVGQHAIFDQAVLDTPEIDAAYLQQQDEKPWQVVLKRFNKLSIIDYPFNPLDVVGWHGDVSVVRINWQDIRPLMSHRFHLPPSAHSTFVTSRFVVCTFVPRPMETDQGALKVPFYHSNDDFDEVIFYHQGEFFSRDNIEQGMLTFHPCGFTHGPHPKAYRTGYKSQRKETDEVAVMIDTRDGLDIGSLMPDVEWRGYIDSWKE